MTFFHHPLKHSTSKPEISVAPPVQEPVLKPDRQQIKQNSNTIRLTIISMVIAILLYGLFFGFPFALGFILMITVHEMGHVIMLRLLGYRSTTPVFIPFVGAVIGMQDRPANARDEAITAFGGPLIGTIGAYITYLYWKLSGEQIFLMLAFTGFIINLFNLVPVSPLDGGRIATAISRWLWLPGLAILILLFVQIWNPILLIVIIIGIQRTYNSLFNIEDLAKTGYYTVKTSTRLIMTLAYVALAFFLAYITTISYHQLLLK